MPGPRTDNLAIPHLVETHFAANCPDNNGRGAGNAQQVATAICADAHRVLHWLSDSPDHSINSGAPTLIPTSRSAAARR
jgi:hypothetical protein